MKSTNVIIAICCVVFCILGWVLMVTDTASAQSEYKQNITLAEAFMEKGLYQRAIKSYMAAFDSENSREVAEAITNAYSQRFIEEPDGTYEAFVDDLEKLLDVYPDHEEMSKTLANLYMIQEDYKKAYSCLKTAYDNGVNSEDFMSLLREARYAYKVDYREYASILPSVTTSMVVQSENKLYGLYDEENGMFWGCEYPYVSQLNADGVAVVTMEEDSRLIDGTGMVMGIFQEKITDASLFSNGLVAVSSGGKYAYYNEFAAKQFGDFEMAGTFVDGLAAVKKSGKWVVIDTEGEEQSKSFADIVLNTNKEYMVGGYVLAAESTGSYKVYDSKWKEVGDLSRYDAVDILTADGLIAVCKGGKWGFAKITGEEVIAPAYENAHSFSNGLAAVCKDGMWGFIDPHGNAVIDFQFANAGYFNNAGTVAVCTATKQKEVQYEIVETETSESLETVVPSTESQEMEETEEPNADLEVEFVIEEAWSILELYNGITGE